VHYVGITNNVDLRTFQHQQSGRLGREFDLVAVERNITYAQARGYEQADIKHYDVLRLNERGQPIVAGSGNRQNSYDESRNDVRASKFREHEVQRSQHHSTIKTVSGKCGVK